MTRLRHALPFLLTLPLFACGTEEAKKPPYQLVLEAGADDGTPLSGVTFKSGKSPLGTTTDTGKLTVKLRGSEGSQIPIHTECPDGYQAPGDSKVRLARVKSISGDGDEPISFSATCTKTERDVVVVVHTDSIAGIPVKIDGAPAGETDENGNAHVAVSVARDIKTLSVSLDTSEFPKLRPENPSRVYELHGRDAVALFNQPLTEVRPKRAYRPKTSAGRHVPYRMN